jgi:hypothetical protein
MSSFPENKIVELPQEVLGTVDTGIVPIDLNQMSDKGFEYFKGTGAAFTATLQGSVAGKVWTEIDDLTSTAQGAIPAQYNYARVNITVADLLGTDTTLYVCGKVL